MKKNLVVISLVAMAAACVLSKRIPTTFADGNVQFIRDLRTGSYGNDVRELQQALMQNGYLKASPTGYFGTLTKVALAKWQKDAGISPVAGYFGSKSRAKMVAIMPDPVSMVLAASSTSVTTSTTSGVSALQATLSEENPSAGVLISNPDSAAVRVPVLGIDLIAGQNAVTLSDIKFHKTGMVADNFILGAYLVRDGRVVAPYTSISQGVIDFSNLDLSLAAGEKQTIWLAIDPAQGALSGNKISFSLASAGDLKAVDASGVALNADGSFPLNGNPFTITSVSDPSLAKLTVLPLPVGTQVIPGNLKNLIGQWNFDIDNDATVLKSLTLTEDGADSEAFENVKLFVGGKQIAILPGLQEDGTAYFDMRSAPAALHPGSNLIEVYADITGSPGDSFSMQIARPYDIDIADSNYDTLVAGQADPGTEINIQAGTLVITAVYE